MPTRALFTACNGNYLPGARALLEGARRHHPDIPRFCMVTHDAVDEARGTIGHLAEILTPPRALAGIPERMQMCVFKLFAPLLPVDIVAYIDSDAILCAPVPELWNVSGGKVRGAQTGPRTVLDSVPDRFKENFLAQYGHLAERRCFNGGLFSMECDAWRDLPERYEKAVAEGGYSEGYHPILDQPLLNGIFDGAFEWLPMQYNVADLFDTRIPHDTRVLHFTGGTCKPWDARYPRHEPQWHLWLKHGLGETNPAKLALSWLRVALWTPKRELGRFLRQRREEAIYQAKKRRTA